MRQVGRFLTTNLAAVSLIALSFAAAPQGVWADKEKESGEYEHGRGEYSQGKESYGHGKSESGHDKESYGHGKGDYGHDKGSGHGKGYGGGYSGGHGMGMGGGRHAGTGHLLRHMLKHEKDIGLKEDQVTKLKEMQLNLDRTRIRSEADIMVAERELRALIEDGKSDLSAIESKLKQSESMEVALRLEAIKTRRDALGLLTPEQREKIKDEHGSMMPQHKVPGMRGGHDGGEKDDSKKEDGMKGR